MRARYFSNVILCNMISYDKYYTGKLDQIENNFFVYIYNFNLC